MHWGPGTGEESRAPASVEHGGFASLLTTARGSGGKGEPSESIRKKKKRRPFLIGS